jgi:hypothetical protein
LVAQNTPDLFQLVGKTELDFDFELHAIRDPALYEQNRGCSHKPQEMFEDRGTSRTAAILEL